METPIVNWTNDDVREARDRYVVFRDGSRHKLKLYTDGYAIGEWEGMDIFQVRALLNNTGAVVEKTT